MTFAVSRTALALGLSTLLAACGGGTGANTTPALWETYLAADTPVATQMVTHIDLVANAQGDLITLGNAVYDGTPDTEIFDAEHAISLSKQDRNGNLQWRTSLPYPGTSLSLMQANVDGAGNIYVLGEDFLIKLNGQGQLQWQRVYHDARTISMTLKNGLIYLTGFQTRVVNGNGELQISIDNAGSYPWEIQVLADGSFVQATPAAITRHDASGNLVWSTASPAGVTSLSRIQVDASGNVYVSYLIDENGGNVVSSRLVKLNQSGVMQWNTVIPDNRPASNYYKSGNIHLHLTADGQLLNISSGTKGRQITKINTGTGAVLWEKVYTRTGGVGESYLDANGNLYLAGAQFPQKFDSQGELIASYAMPASFSANSMAVYGNQFFVGSSVSQNDSYQFYTAAFAK